MSASDPTPAEPKGFSPRHRAYLIGGIVLVVFGVLGLLANKRPRRPRPAVTIEVSASDHDSEAPETPEAPEAPDAPRRSDNLRGTDAPFLNRAVILGGSEERVISQAFTGARLKAVMGGIALDLRDAKPAQEPVRIDVEAVCGGIEIRVPRDWEVTVDAKCIAGASDTSGLIQPAPGTAAHHLVIDGKLVCGGLEVTN